jgi:hypothetical protein
MFEAFEALASRPLHKKERTPAAIRLYSRISDKVQRVAARSSTRQHKSGQSN